MASRRDDRATAANESAPQRKVRRVSRDEATRSRKSMYSDTFKNYDQQERSNARVMPVRHKENLIASGAKFEATSVSRDTFRAYNKDGSAMPFIPKENQKKEDGNTRSTSETRNAFRAHPEHRPDNAIKPRGNLEATSHDAFDGVTNNQENFQSWPVHRPTKPAWAKQKPMEVSHEPFAKDSAYKAEFGNQRMPERVKSAKPLQSDFDPVTHRTAGSKDDSWVSSDSSYHEEFKYRPSARQRSCKVSNHYEAPVVRFSAETTSRVSFAEGANHRPEIHNQFTEKTHESHIIYSSPQHEAMLRHRAQSCPPRPRDLFPALVADQGGFTRFPVSSRDSSPTKRSGTPHSDASKSPGRSSKSPARSSKASTPSSRVMSPNSKSSTPRNMSPSKSPKKKKVPTATLR